MSKTSSLAFQIDDIFNHGTAFGCSRDAAKNEMRLEGRDVREMGDHIHSFGSLGTYKSAAIHVAKEIKAEYGPSVKRVADFTPKMIVDYFSQRLKAGKTSKNTLVSEVGALRRLDQLAQVQGKIRQSFMPSEQTLRDMGIKRQFRPHGAYSPTEARAIIRDVSARNPKAGLVLELQYSGGLRIREAVCLKSGLIRDKRAGVDRLGISTVHGRVFVKGKGSRQREIALLDPSILYKLDTARLFPLRDGRLIPTQMRTVQDRVRHACKRLGIQPRGTHAFRAAAAREFYARQLAAGASEIDAKRATSRWLGHNRLDILKHYLVDPQE
jgi:integrase